MLAIYKVTGFPRSQKAPCAAIEIAAASQAEAAEIVSRMVDCDIADLKVEIAR